MRDAAEDVVDQEVIARVASEAEVIARVDIVAVMTVVKARREALPATSTLPSVVALAVVVALLLHHRRRWTTPEAVVICRATFCSADSDGASILSTQKRKRDTRSADRI